MTIEFPKSTDIKSLKALWKEAFGDTDEFIDLFFNTAFTKESALAVYDNEALVASLYWFDGSVANKKAAYIYGVATKKSQRGKGYSTSLLKRCHELLKGEGYSVVILAPADEGLFNFYGRLGYTECCFIDSYKCSASKKKTSLEKISAEEYLILRESFLPDNSLIFDNKRLHFLSSITDFYKSQDFIFAKSKDSATLRIIEFFGNECLIPDIIGTLVYTEATVRRYGKTKPFAMYLSLEETVKEIPEYLGFAFD